MNYFAGKTGVGPGTESPSEQHALHVGGDVRVDGALHTSCTAANTGQRVQRAAVHSADHADALTVVLSGTVVVTDGKSPLLAGAAVEEASLPGAELSYQLTPVGAPMPSLHVAAENVGGVHGIFEIGGAVVGKKVSWTLTVVVAREACM